MFQNPSTSSDLSYILPILMVCVTACVILLGDVFLWSRSRVMSPVVAILGLLLTGWFLHSGLDMGDVYAFGTSLHIDNLFTASSYALVVTGILSILMAATYLQNRGLSHGEYYVLLLFSLAGAMLMAASQELIVLFLGLEVLSFALYVMAGFARTEERSEEASIKYFLLGAFASAFFLYGIALTYGAMQTTNLGLIAENLASGHGRSPMMLAGIGLILVGLGFKAAVIPFHQWTPDVYEGAPTSVTAYMAGGAKIGAFAAMLRVFGAMIPLHAFWLPAVQVLAILTMVVGNLLAVQQTNVKRMLAYSSIAHAGYLLVAVAAMAHGSPGSPVFAAAQNSAMFYLFAYVFMTLGAFGVLVYLTSRERDCQQLNDLRGLARTEPGAAYTMLFFMLSLGGIPPTMGFMGKWQIFLAALEGHEITLAIVMALASVISVYYYLKIVWMMCFEEPTTAPARPAATHGGALASVMISAAATILFGIVPYALSGFTTVWGR